MIKDSDTESGKHRERKQRLPQPGAIFANGQSKEDTYKPPQKRPHKKGLDHGLNCRNSSPSWCREPVICKRFAYGNDQDNNCNNPLL